MKYALVYGGIAGAIVVSIISATIAMDLPSHATSMWVGYLVMLAALSLIFVGVKRYRDVECGGVIRFGRAFGLGLAIAAVAALVYVAGWELYLAVLGKDFMAEYSAGILADLRSGGAGRAELDAKAAEMRALAESYRNPLFRMPLTFVEIFPVGLVVALVSAALLRNPRMLPARG
ncbi:MAG TPA: DUF4199 domain-containing protein [Allosphingosinicella sp.]|jgi:hypothetical protein